MFKAIESGLINQAEAEDASISMLADEFRKLTGGVVQKPDGSFELVNQIAFNNRIEDLRVLARATSEDKFILAVGL